jgi:hypothetical protein
MPIHPETQGINAVLDTRGQVSEAPGQKSIAKLDDLLFLRLGLDRHGGVSESHRRRRQGSERSTTTLTGKCNSVVRSIR